MELSGTIRPATYKRAFELLQAQLRRIGIDIKLSVADHSAFHARIQQNLNPINPELRQVLCQGTTSAAEEQSDDRRRYDAGAEAEIKRPINERKKLGSISDPVF
jgi:hypothetical protein